MTFKGFLFVSFFSTLLLLCSIPCNGEGSDFVADDFTKAWGEYIANPDENTAADVVLTLPHVKVDIQLPVSTKELIKTNVHVLESEIYSSKRNSLKLAFRLFSIADDEIAKLLEKVIGYLMRVNTKLFLQELKVYEKLVPNLSSLVCSFRLNAPEDISQQKLEKNIRLKALSYIDSKSLKAIKKKCTKILKKMKL